MSCTIASFTIDPTPTPTPMPVPTSDEDFSKLANDICETLQLDIELSRESTENVQGRMRPVVDACRQAGEKMGEFDLDEDYAPNAFLLRKSLSERRDILEAYTSEFTETQNTIEIPAYTPFNIIFLKTDLFVPCFGIKLNS